MQYVVYKKVAHVYNNTNKSIDTSSKPSSTNIANPVINENKDDLQMIGPPTSISATLSQPIVRIRYDSVPSQEDITEPEQDNISKDSDIGELVKILKMGLVKGEISKKEFIELRQLVED